MKLFNGFMYTIIQNIKTFQCQERYMTTKLKRRNRKLILFLQGNGVEVHKLTIYSLKLLKLGNCAIFQRPQGDKRLVMNVPIL